MAQWVLACPGCNKEFIYMKAPSDAGIFASWSVKPEFPHGGLTVTCPNCQKSSVYQRHQLVYRAARGAHGD
jgi:hypothetical protein